MRAAIFDVYGDPDVLTTVQVPDPEPGPGEVLVAVRAASVNPIDWKLRSGRFTDAPAPDEPMIIGNDASGVIVALGDGVTDVAVGDEVFGLGRACYAELAVLEAFARKPAEVDHVAAAAAATVGETAIRVLGLTGLESAGRLLIDGGAGGVGSAAVEIAVGRGLAVIATGSAANHDYLRSLGATPIEYGSGLADRVRAIWPDGPDAVFDVAGKTPAADLIGLVAAPERVISIANFAEADTGIQVTDSAPDREPALRQLADLLAAGGLRVPVRTFPLDQAAEAHRLSQDGHVRGKLVLEP
jgi:NADPH:quinone reductase-like Zn-dependent oxidoreductase